jgi:hypothetical protein
MRGSRKLMTAAELAYLCELPSARLKAPVARLPEPRLDVPAITIESSPQPVSSVVRPNAHDGSLDGLGEMLGARSPESANADTTVTTTEGEEVALSA